MIKKLFLICLFVLSLNGCHATINKSKDLKKTINHSKLQNNKKIIISSLNKDFNILNTKKYLITKNKIIYSSDIYNNIIYIIDNAGNIIAFSIEEKKILWSRNITPINQKIHGGIIYNNQKLYITFGSRFLVILDSKTGYEMTRKKFPDIIMAKPVLTKNNLLLIQTINNQLTAIDINTLKSLWEYTGTEETLSSEYYPYPIIYKNQILTYCNSGTLVALDEHGKVLWNIKLFQNTKEIEFLKFNNNSLSCTPIIFKEKLYLANKNGTIIKFDILSQKILWQNNLKDIQSMKLLNNSLFVTNIFQDLIILDLDSGEINMTKKLYYKNSNKKIVGFFLNPILTQDNRIYYLNIIANNGILYKFSSNHSGELIIQEPKTLNIVKKIQYYKLLNNEMLYFLTEQEIYFLRQK